MIRFHSANIKDHRTQPSPPGGLPIKRWSLGAIEIENNHRKIHHHGEGERRIKDGHPCFPGSETERSTRPFSDKVKSKHFGGTTKCFCGKEIDGTWDNTTAPVKNNYLYNGKELHGWSGLNWSDYGARWYMPEIGRWNSVDPLAHMRPGLSPYNYCSGNPIGRTDPSGMIDDWYQNNETSKVEWHEGSEKKDGYTHLGSTVVGTDQSGNTMYGAQDGKWYDSVPLEGATITGSPAYRSSAAYAMFGELASGKNLSSDNP